MATVEKPWTCEQLSSDGVSKKDLVQYLQDKAAPKFLQEQKLQGSLKNVTKTSKKDHLISVYNELFDKQAFKGTDYDVPVDQVVHAVKQLNVADTKTPVVEESGPPKFKKFVLKKGDKTNFPKKGDKVSCYYTGKLENGTVFDSVQKGTKKKRIQPISFNVGKGHVIRGWDEALLGMSVGEVAQLTIEPEWGYGKPGKPEAKIPSMATLIFEVELTRID